MDTHAETCVVGKNALIVHNFDRPVNICGYDPEGPVSESLDTVSAALAYDHPVSGEVVILMLHQAIHIEHLDHNLLSPMQLRLNDVKVNDVPKFLTEQPTDETHAIVVAGDDLDDILLIPLSLEGVTSMFPTRKPTPHEYETCARYELTYESPEYDPKDSSLAKQEDSMTDSSGRLRNTGDRGPHARRVCSVSQSQSEARLIGENMSRDDAILHSISNTLHDRTLLSGLQECVQIAGVQTVAKRQGIDAPTLAKNWGIGLQTAKRTITATTQRGIRTVLHPSLSRRFRTNDRQLRYRRLPITCYTDTMKSETLSRRGNKYAQIYCTPSGWTRAFPMKKKSEAHETLSLLHARDGVPNVMIMDGAPEQTMGEFRRKCRQADCHVRTTEPHTPWSNAAEGGIRELKKGTGREMVRSKCPKRLWDDCLEREAYIRSNTAHDIYELNGEVPETIVSGETSDISTFAEYQWYQWVKFRDTAVSFPQDKVVLGRDLGPAIDIGPAMTRKVLKSNGQVVHRSTVRPLTPDEMDSPEEKRERDEFDASVRKALGGSLTWDDLKDDPDYETPILDPYEDDEQEKHQVPDIDDADVDTYDQYVNAEVKLPKGDRELTGKVIGRKRERDGTVRGKANANPILDTRTYEVEFPDGQVAEYTANVIAESMYAQCDMDGNQQLLLQAIVDFRKDGHAVEVADMYVQRGNNRHLRKTTKGWHLCVEWKDGSTTWERLADLKESYPVEVAEYAIAQGIDHEPAFAWWAPYVLKRRNRIIAAVNKRYHKRTHKFGIRVPKTWDEAVEIDKENGNTLWQEAVRKEMSNVQIAFKILDNGEVVPPSFQEIRCHLIFDVKIEDFRRKARLVAGGHMTETPATMTFASVVSRESVRIALTLAALNDLDVKTADIQNAYLTAPASEKIWTKLGPEFGADAGKKAIIVRSLYGLKSAGASFRNHLADCMMHLGWQPCKADQDLWFKPETRPDDGHKYYAYALIYVDDIACVHHDAENALHEIDKYFEMKSGSIGDPDYYLGAKLRKTTLPNGVVAWGMSTSKYVLSAVNNVKDYLAQDGGSLPKRAATPFPQGYRPELDISPELDADKASYFQSQIGVLRWCVEIGRIDIITEVSLLASHLALPREGHLEAVFHIFAYIEKKHNSRVVFDPTYPEIDMRDFKECDWKSFYGDVKEAIPPNAPDPRGKEVDIRLYVDSDHAGDQLTRRSRTGFFIFLNMAPITWFSKRQATIETSVFGAEFVAMKNGMETLRGLRYKLRMMGVPLSGPSFIYGDNMSVIHNTQRPESTLKKKSNSICYHAVRESVAMGESLTGHVSTDMNPADICTKVLSGGQKRDHLIGLVLYDITDH